MSRRRWRRERPATPEEQAAFERAAELAKAVIDAPPAERRAAAGRLRRAVYRIQDPDNLANLTTAELVDELRKRRLTEQERAGS